MAKARKWRKEGRNHLRKKIKGGNVKKEERERESVWEKRGALEFVNHEYIINEGGDSTILAASRGYIFYSPFTFK